MQGFAALGVAISIKPLAVANLGRHGERASFVERQHQLFVIIFSILTVITGHHARLLVNYRSRIDHGIDRILIADLIGHRSDSRRGNVTQAIRQ